ncbi:hypothetical protein [Caulobacter sp. RL271]|uniref:Uncharacterized protein n=1 Tax=Caulobacter segnis TaxID=88688 RepID=A0ABY4ZXJ4_9CAUL|nr:hypothetical protein [Caulobacter segnis]USQ97273.1 hypothetical protein MZV50_06940 [Caulobacter segnis]
MVIETFIQRCDAVASRRGISRSRVSTLIFNDGKKLDFLADGRDIGVRTLAVAEEKLVELEKAAAEFTQ